MKKHLIAAAVAGALAVPAMAQVTVSGYVEAGYVDQETSTAEANQVVGGIFGSPRLVISGSEDLGGGMKAGFRLERGLNVTTGALGGTNGAMDRGAEINLSGAFGMVRIGKFDHQGGENNDLNVIGNVALFTGTSGFGSVTASVEQGTDRDGTIAYRTPSFAGATLEIAHTPEDQAANVVGAADDFGLTSVFVSGKMGGVGYRAGWSERKPTASTKDTNTGIAISYDFGVASASLAYQKMDAATVNTDRQEMVLSVKVPLGNGLDLRGLYKDYSHDVAANDVKTMGLGAGKALSKRTTLLAFYRDVERAARDDTQLYLGVAHSF